jgi:hypothetical protein
MSSKRIPVAVEGRVSTDRRFIEPGALVLPIGPVPVTRPGGGEEGTEIVGKALGFEREDGTIYADVDLIEGDLPDDWTPSLSVDSLETKEEGEVLRVVEARVRSVHMLTGPGNAWPEIDRGT